MRCTAWAWDRPEAVGESFYTGVSSPSSTKNKSSSKVMQMSSYQASSVKDRKECTALVSDFYVSLGTFATPHGFTQEIQNRYANLSAIKKTLLEHTAYKSLYPECIEEMDKDESKVMFNVFANLYPNGHLQDNAQTRDLSKTLFEGCKSYSDPTLGSTAKSDATMFCEYTEWIS